MNINYPQFLRWTAYAIINMLYQLIASFTGRTVQVLLYTNNVTWTPQTTLGSLVEANYTNYSRPTITTWNGPFNDGLGNIYADAPLQTFQGGGGVGNVITGLALIEQNGGTQATMTATYLGGTLTAINVTNGGTLYEGNVILTITGGGMTVAPTYTVNIGAGGVITSVTLLTGGTFTSAPTIVVETPKSIIDGGPFPTPATIQSTYDALEIVPQIKVPPLQTM